MRDHRTTTLSERLAGESVLIVEATIPGDVTIDEWRRRRTVRARRPKGLRGRLRLAAR